MIQSDQIEVFGQTPSGEQVHRITLTGSELTAKVLTFGATIQDLRFAGFDHPLVLGSETLEPYWGNMRYVGALVGRYANRIAKGCFAIDGKDYQVSQNFLGKHCLHGGEQGSDQMVWAIESLAPDRVILSLVMPDGHMGFPGELRVQAEISLSDDNALQFAISATTTKATPCCFAHHGYFNLDGGQDITTHKLRVFAESYLPVDDDLIPTGGPSLLKGSPFDFRKPEAIGCRGLDHNFCLASEQRDKTKAAKLSSEVSGLSMSIETTEPGLQVYDGAYFPDKGLRGLDGRTYGPRAGLALETQTWPDAPNRPGFPKWLLRPGDSHSQNTSYKFTRIT